jgi:glycerophosphoryl diester phosphodiesterase
LGILKQISSGKVLEMMRLFIFTVFIWISSANAVEVQGHRGARWVRPENTIPAFAYALEAGVDTLELDVVVTKDNYLVVHHDRHVNSTICRFKEEGGTSERLVIRDLTLKEVKKFDCGGVKNPRFPDQVLFPGTPMPTLAEVFEFVKTSNFPAAAKVKFNIETKISPEYPKESPTPKEFARLVVEEIEKYRMVERSNIQSFDFRTLIEAKKLRPKIKVAPLLGSTFPDMVGLAKKLQAFAVSPNHRWITEEQIKALHQVGVKVIPWTLNTESDWTRMVSFGVDGIITDRPKALKAYLNPKK